MNIEVFRQRRPSWLASVCWIVVGSAVTLELRADDLTLKDGRRIIGNVIKKTDESLVIELSPGNKLLISQADVKKHQQNSKGEAAYLEGLKAANDTVESQLQMASLAHRNQMLDHERAHYERVLELEPENSLARAALGFVKNKDGRWILRDEQMREGRGKVLVGGKRYRFPELVAMQEAEDKFNAERAQLANEIRRAVSNLANPRNGAKAQATLDGLEGPLASSAITFMLYPRGTKNSPTPATKLMFLPILERLGDANAAQLLIRFCLELDRGPEQAAVRQQSLIVLKKIAPDAAFQSFMAALSSNSNTTINLAAELLQELGDERSVLPLIDRLVTVERREYGGGQQTMAGMSNGDVSFSKGDPKIVRNENINNAGVRSALASITQQDFGYDKNAWLNWYSQTYLSHYGDLRRDP